MIKLFSAEAGEIGSISEFEWSENEKVWPFEKGPSGETIYAKQINVANLPNTGFSDHAINPSQPISKVFHIYTIGGRDDWGWVPGNFPSYWSFYVLGESPPNQRVRAETLNNRSNESATIRVLYMF